MSKKTAFFILLIIFLMMIGFFVVLSLIYNNIPGEQKNAPVHKTAEEIREKKKQAADQAIRREIDEIVANGEKENKSKDEIRQEVVDLLNADMQKREAAKTPEELEADRQAQIKRLKMIQNMQ